MIVKHFYCNKLQLGGNWENTDHMFGAPDSDMQVEQNVTDHGYSSPIAITVAR